MRRQYDADARLEGIMDNAQAMKDVNESLVVVSVAGEKNRNMVALLKNEMDRYRV